MKNSLLIIPIAFFCGILLSAWYDEFLLTCLFAVALLVVALHAHFTLIEFDYMTDNERPDKKP